jgi:tetratricopeptide (TPR) repeat protein
MQLVADHLTEKEGGTWLLILDNADDLEMLTASPTPSKSPPLASYIPHSASGQVIITTRDAHVGLVLSGGRDPIAVYPLTPTDAALLLRTSLAEEPDPDPDTVLQILNILDCLPLAITQACAYINRNKILTTQYLALLTENDAGLRELLSDDQYDLRRGFDSINSVIRTWKISFDHIQNKYSNAAEVLSTMAFLNRQDIPRDLLLGVTETQQQLTSALGVLQAFSLIKSERGSETFSMHRLVQFVTCVWQEMQGSKSKHQEQALDLVLAKFPAAENEDPTRFQSLLPHAYAVQICAATSNSIRIKLSDLQYNMSWFEDWRGHYQAGKTLCSSALNVRKATLGESHLDTLHASDLLGTVLKHQGSYSEAASIHKEALKHKSAIFGLSHLDTVQSLSDLTDIFIVQGDFEAAENSARQVLTARAEILGTEHLKTLSITTTLAYIFKLRGNLNEACQLARDAAEKYRRILGCEHEKTLLCTSTLYQILREMGQYQEAIDICLEVIAIRRTLLGPEHPHTLSAINNLAMLRRNTGEYEVAEQLYRANIAIFEKSLGKEHPETMANSSNLAVVLRDQEKFEEAEQWSRQTLERRERVLGKVHPRTLITLNEHAILLDKMGKHNEALEAATCGLHARLKALGEEHPDCATSLCTLASVVRHQGDLKSARDLLERALGIRTRLLKENHPDTLACVVELETLLQEQKNDPVD